MKSNIAIFCVVVICYLIATMIHFHNDGKIDESDEPRRIPVKIRWL